MSIFVCAFLSKLYVPFSLKIRGKDTDRSGTIGFNEFAGLWKYVKVHECFFV